MGDRPGHRATAGVAMALLSPSSQNALTQLLGDGETLVSVCDWADKIKGDPQWKWASVLHYVNIVDVWVWIVCLW